MLGPPPSPREVAVILFRNVRLLEAMGLDREAPVEAVTKKYGIDGSYKVVAVIQSIDPDLGVGAVV